MRYLILFVLIFNIWSNNIAVKLVNPGIINAKKPLIQDLIKKYPGIDNAIVRDHIIEDNIEDIRELSSFPPVIVLELKNGRILKYAVSGYKYQEQDKVYELIRN